MDDDDRTGWFVRSSRQCSARRTGNERDVDVDARGNSRGGERTTRYGARRSFCVAVTTRTTGWAMGSMKSSSFIITETRVVARAETTRDHHHQSSSDALRAVKRDGEGARRRREGRLTVYESMVCLFRAVGRRTVKRGGTCATRSMAGAVKVRRFNFFCAVVFFLYRFGSVRFGRCRSCAAMMRR